ncbi:MAG: hypothetical protein SPI30_00085 [Prevotella sp.]|nr:hypothetical protein [Prevotella sp.]
MIPVVGSIRTNDWYCGYQCLVRFVPDIGTMTKPFRAVSPECLVEV